MSCIRTKSAEPPSVAFSVSRAVGGAVVRNRLRRRLRAAVREHADLLLPGAAYLVAATPGATTTTFRDLSGALRSALAELREDETP